MRKAVKKAKKLVRKSKIKVVHSAREKNMPIGNYLRKKVDKCDVLDTLKYLKTVKYGVTYLDKRANKKVLYGNNKNKNLIAQQKKDKIKLLKLVKKL